MYPALPDAHRPYLKQANMYPHRAPANGPPLSTNVSSARMTLNEHAHCVLGDGKRKVRCSARIVEEKTEELEACRLGGLRELTKFAVRYGQLLYPCLRNLYPNIITLP